MENRPTGALLRHLRELVEPHAVRELGDAELLGRFVRDRDEAAFTALVLRHGRLVWNVCRRVLGDDHDADDAFQATFLVLARKAGGIRKERSVASWLYGVAYRLAQKARVAAARRRRHESRAAPMPTTKSSSDVAWRELQAILDQELNRLPAKYRAPFLLCVLEGKSKPEAAGELGWKEGTVSSRLAHARAVLQNRLARRGVVFSLLLCGTALAHDTASAALPAILVAATVKAALAFAAGHALGAGASAAAVTLARSTLRAMALGRLRLLLIGLLVLGLVGTSAAWIGRPPRDEGPNDRPRPDASPIPGQPVQQIAQRQTTAGQEKLTVRGHAVDLDGRPLAGARMAVVGGVFRQSGREVLQAGQADVRGRFYLEFTRPFARRYYGVSLLIAAPGYAPSWYAVSPSEGSNELECRLEPGQAVGGQLLDAQGAPAKGVRVDVVGLAKQGPGSSVLRFRRRPTDLLPWPASVTTDEDGRFELRDVPGGDIDLQVHDPRFAPQWLVLRSGARVQPVKLSLAPLRILEGTVTAADTGAPLPRARLMVQSFGPGAPAGLICRVDGETDAAGRFRLAPFPGQELVISASPAAGAPYLTVQQSEKWPGGPPRRAAAISLPRGVPVHGQVVEGPSGRPVADAVIEYEPRTETNAHARMTAGRPLIDWWSQDIRTGSDGAFAFTALPGAGWLLVKGSTPDYLHVEVSARQLACGKAGGTPYFPDAVVPLDLDLRVPAQDVVATLRRGRTVTGRVVDHNGHPATCAFLLAPSYRPSELALRGNQPPLRLAAHGGRFELPGCDPDNIMSVLFWDLRCQQGAVAQISGKQAGEDVVVRLAPCGSAVTRFQDAGGRAVPPPRLRLDVLLRPGAELQESVARQIPACVAVPVQRLSGSPGIRFDAETRTVVFSGLIPGATYLVLADEGNGLVRKLTFQARTGRQSVPPAVVLGGREDRSP